MSMNIKKAVLRAATHRLLDDADTLREPWEQCGRRAARGSALGCRCPSALPSTQQRSRPLCSTSARRVACRAGPWQRLSCRRSVTRAGVPGRRGCQALCPARVSRVRLTRATACCARRRARQWGAGSAGRSRAQHRGYRRRRAVGGAGNLNCAAGGTSALAASCCSCCDFC